MVAGEGKTLYDPSSLKNSYTATNKIRQKTKVLNETNTSNWTELSNSRKKTKEAII